MPFTTAGFLFFFLPLSIILYYLLNLLGKAKINNILLILLSLVFYMVSGVRTTAYLVAFIVIVYAAGRAISYIKKKDKQRNVFIVSLVFIVLTLSYYKYITFILGLLGKNNGEFSVVIPLGLSFIMFEGISYLIDIYKEEAPNGDFIDTLLFFTFFPKVSSGPIVLWKDFSKQLEKRNVSVDLFFSGMNRIMIGFAKKSIIADSLGLVLQNITTNATLGIDSPTAFLGALCYFVQIYYDFSGYSDIAIGISRIFGFQLQENFNFPYTSTSIGEFWRRWHISLGRWFREYIYIPLGGNRKHVYMNLFIVFLITGIWHGSTLNFVIWGVVHGILSLIERRIRNKDWYLKIPSIIKWLFTTIFVYLTWIIFMIPSLSEAITYFKAMLGRPAGEIYFTYEYFMNSKVALLIVIGLVGAFIGKWDKIEVIKKWSSETKVGLFVSQVLYLVVFIVAILFMMNSSYSPFLYFQF